MDTGTGPTFGDLLRLYRDSADLTQEDLAVRTGLTPQAIGLLERGERRRPHRYTVQKLVEALELAEPDRARFESAARGSSARHATRTSLYRLPTPSTPLVGREHEAATVACLVHREEVRMLTLTGPGGVGKTRLAVEVAGRSRDTFADGVVFVPLAPLQDPALVPSALAETLGLRDVKGQTLRKTLEKHLRGRQMLLLLDNFEHLLGAVPAVADLLGACPELTVLVTSRAPLRLAGEHQFPVPPLPLPQATSPETADILLHYPAVELFRQRALAVMPAFELTATNAATVAQICHRLDGLPLAIELGAARVKLFPPQALLARLDRRLQLLAGGARDLPERQQTLRQAIAWSYDLLDAGEQVLFRRLAVFAGGCTLEAAEAVCGSGVDGQVEISVLEALASLVDNSLLVSLHGNSAHQEEYEEPRFTMLETIREYASERLVSSGEAEEMRRKHVSYYLSLANTERAEPFGSREAAWMARWEEDHDNLRAALRWSVQSRDLETGARLVLALWRFWIGRGYQSEGLRWAEAVLALDRAEDRAGEGAPTLSAGKRAFLLSVTGNLAMGQGDRDRAAALYGESLDVHRSLGEKKIGMALVMHALGIIAYEQGDYERAALLLEQALSISREREHTWGIAAVLSAFANVIRAQGNLDRATAMLEESLALFRSLGHSWGIARSLNGLAEVAREEGKVARASQLYGESLELERAAGNKPGIVACLEGLARVAIAQGLPERAARLCGAAAALREEVGAPVTPVARAEHERTMAAARTKLGEDAFATAWARGHALSLEEAIADASGKDE